MPGGDRTGPWGAGPRTGRAAGFCAGYEVPGAMNPAVGRGLGLGGRWGAGRGIGWRAGSGYNWGRQWGRSWTRGPGWGWGWRAYPPVEVPGTSGSQPVNLKALELQLEALDAELSEIRRLLRAGEPSERGGEEK